MQGNMQVRGAWVKFNLCVPYALEERRFMSALKAMITKAQLYHMLLRAKVRLGTHRSCHGTTSDILITLRLIMTMSDDFLESQKNRIQTLRTDDTAEHLLQLFSVKKDILTLAA